MSTDPTAGPGDPAGVTEHVALARAAREALATARDATLHVAGLTEAGGLDGPAWSSDGDDPGSGLDAPFADVDGRPTFWCPEGSRVVTVAAHRAPAILAVPAGRHRTLVLAGRLAPGPTHDGAVAVTLELHSVVVEQDAPDEPLVHLEVPLAAWWAADPDPLVGPAARLVTHANRAHAEHLRTWVAGLRGLDPDSVLAAELRDLDAEGVEVRWLDDRGGHTTRVRFPQPARCAAHLGDLLREALQV